MSQFYDADRWREHIAQWAEELFNSEHATAEQVVPEQPSAALEYTVTWKRAASDSPASLPPDVTTVSHAACETFGPLARIVECDFRKCALRFCVMDMPPSAKQRLASVLSNAERLLSFRKRYSLRSYALLFGASLVEFSVACVLLHNHWYSYEEPWHTPLEFVYYHLPFFGGGNTH